jgi:HK97 family phage prohead protease
MPERQILSLDEFTRKALAARKGLGPAPGDFIIRSPVTAAAQPAAGDDRRIPFVVATGNTNRNGWQLNSQGWEFANYLNNPVMLWAHDDTKLPVAKAEKVWVDGDALKVVALFTPAGFSGFNDAIFECYQQKFLNAVSAGWIPLEYEFIEDTQGWRIMCSRQELVEISFVPVPAEPNALRLAAKAGIDVGPLRAWARAMVGEPRYVLHAEGILTPETKAAVQERFAEFYPGAKLFIVEMGRLAPLDDLAAVQDITVEDLEAEIAAVQAGRVIAGTVPSNASTDLAPKDAAWSAPALADFTDKPWDELDAQEKRHIAGHFAWSSEMPPAAFGSLKLPHHEPHGGKVVWKGCTAAMGRCMQANTEIPHADLQRVYNHLAKHYQDFNEQPPEFHYPGAAIEQPSGPAGAPAAAAEPSSTTPAAGTPAAAGDPGAVSAALARYNRRIRLLEL